MGKTTLERFPNLRWIVCRSHGIDTVNVDDCVKWNVGVVSTNPHSTQCANWIYDKMKDFSSVTIFGNGSISKALQTKLDTYNVVDTKTPQHQIDDWLKESKTVISILPYNDNTENYFDKYKFNLMPNGVNFISISRGDLFNMVDLREFAEGQKLSEGHFDMLSPNDRDNLLKNKNIHYYEHTSFDFGEQSEEQYASKLELIFNKCLSDTVQSPDLPRTQNKWF